MLLTFVKDKLTSYANKIDFIETGTAPMPLEDMHLLCQVLPQTRLYNTYASTETGIISTFNYNDGECLAGCLGTPMKQSSFFITDDGVVGCKEKTYDGIFITADLGSIDMKGRLRLHGRSDDVINVGGYKIAPTEVEDIALAFSGVKDCICIEAPHPVVGKVLKLLIVPDVDYNRKNLVNYLKSKLESHKVPVLYGEIADVRRTFNGKIDRKSYR